MNQNELRPSVALRRLTNGYQISQAIYVAATLGLADHMSDGPRTAEELASITNTYPSALYRLLRALGSVGVFEEDEALRFSLTAIGECLRSNATEPVGGWAAFIGQPYHWQAWGDLLHSVRTGESAFEHVHGTDPWTYRREHPELGAVFDGAMAAIARQVSHAVLSAFNFSRFKTIVDVGGGNGAFLGAILKQHSGVRGILFDLPHVVAGAELTIGDSAVSDRFEVVGGDAFELIPAGGDAYILKSVIHDWDDRRAMEILKVCRNAMTSGAAVLVVERELGRPNEMRDGKFSDLNMLVATGGRERTTAEYAKLFLNAGFELVHVTPSAIGFSVFEGRPK